MARQRLASSQPYQIEGAAMIKDLDVVALTRDVPEHGLVAGDIGTVVFVYDTKTPGPAYEVEFAALDGTSIAIVTVEAPSVRPIRAREIAHGRQVA
jgi:hypothetical protein